MRIVAVGVDPTSESEAAACWAAASGRADRLILAHGYANAYDYSSTMMLLAPLTEHEVESLRDHAVGRVEQLAARIRDRYPDLVVSTLVEHDFAIPLLTRISADVDLLVVGHHRPGLIERLTTGSVSAALSARSACPVVTVPFGNLAADGPVVAAVDIDAPSETALSTSFRYADATGHPVAVICAIPEAADPAHIEQVYVRAEAMIEPWRRRHPECTVSLQLVNGDPHRAVVRAVPHASLLVVTRPRAGTAFPTWSASVTRAAQGSTSCPIAVVDHSTERTR